jgi:hypothetical protein
MVRKNHILLTVFCLSLVCAQCLFANDLNQQPTKQELAHRNKKKKQSECRCYIRIIDAKDGSSVTNAHISIEKFGDFTTDSLGRACLKRPIDGKYTFTFQKEGYVTATYQFEIMGMVIPMCRYSVCRVMPDEGFTLTLDWDKDPSDLDLHLVKHSGYHITFRNPKVVTAEVALLQRDDYRGYGPETITVNELDKDAIYTIYVHDFTHQYAKRTFNLSYSRAIVRLYYNNQLKNEFRVPIFKMGNKWTVFQFRKGEISIVNKFSDSR